MKCPNPGRSWFIVFLILCGFDLLGTPVAAKDYRGESYQSEVRMSEDGTLLVHEVIRIRFQGGTFTFFYRSIPRSRTEKVEIISTSDSATTRIHRSAVDITWHFPPSRDTTCVFTLEYRVEGAVALEEDHFRIRWTPFPQDRPYAIDAAGAVLHFPVKGAEVLGVSTRPRAFRSRPVQCSTRRSAEGVYPIVQLDALSLKPKQTVTVAVDFASPAFRVSPPAWQRQIWRWQKQTPNLLLLSAFVLVIGLVRIFSLRAQLRSRLQMERGPLPGGPIPIRSEPPSDLPAPLAGALRDGAVDPADALSCIFELARHGVVRIEEAPRRFRFSGKAPSLRRIDHSLALSSWETILLDGIMEQADSSGSVPWVKAQNGMSKRFKAFSDEVMSELARRGEIDPAARSDRKKLYRSAYFGLASACVVLVGVAFLVREFGPAILAIPAAGLIAALAGTIAAGTYPLWTLSGAEHAREWRGFARTLRTAARKVGTNAGAASFTADRFHTWLPYAVVFNAGPQWLKAGKKLGYPVPEWFLPLAGSEGDFGALIAVVSLTSTSSGRGVGGGGAGGSSGAG